MYAKRCVAGGVGSLLLALACSGGEKTPPAQPAAGAAPAAPQGPMGSASVIGEVKFTGTAPVNPPIDMSEEAACKAKYQATPHAETVVVNPNHTLANVFVYVKAGLPAGATYPPPSTPVTIDQAACRYHPHVFGVMAGQTLRIQNSDPLLHNIKAVGKANRPFNISQPAAGMVTERTFAAPEVMVPLECNVHGWMRAYVGVVSHPFYATTGADGRFTIANLPAGTYTIEAWQERLGIRTATVTVGEDETKTVTLTYSP